MEIFMYFITFKEGGYIPENLVFDSRCKEEIIKDIEKNLNIYFLFFDDGSIYDSITKEEFGDGWDTHHFISKKEFQKFVDEWYSVNQKGR